MVEADSPSKGFDLTYSMDSLQVQEGPSDRLENNRISTNSTGACSEAQQCGRRNPES